MRLTVATYCLWMLALFAPMLGYKSLRTGNIHVGYVLIWIGGFVAALLLSGAYKAWYGGN